MSRSKPIRIVSMGKYLPKTVSSQALELKYALPVGWSEKYSGVASRHWATQEYNGTMGALAADEALEKADLKLADMDMLLSAGGTFDHPIPNQASVIKAEMKDGNDCHVPAIHLDSTCLSFVAAFEMAASLLDGDKYKHILIVCSEIASKAIDPDNWETLTLFGDGAVAVVLSYDSASESAYIDGLQQTYSEGLELAMIAGGGNRYFFKEHSYNKELHSFSMKGKQLLRLASKKLPKFIEAFYHNNPYSMGSVDAIIPHQASKLGISILPKMAQVDSDKIHQTLHKYGNCIAASIPLTLMDAIDAGKVSRGDVCCLIGTSAGFSIGAILIRY